MKNWPAVDRQLLLLATILVWAGVLRLGWPGVNSFSFDEARVSQLALQMVRNGDLAELGMQSSTGVPNFPGAVWIYALPYAISSRPLAATLFTGLANTLTAAGLWWLARQGWGKAAGPAAALAFAAAPFLIFYARNIWAQNWLVPLAVLWAIAAVQGIGRGKNGALAWHTFLAGFAAQVHFAGIVLAFGSLWLGLRFRLWRRWRPIAAGVLFGVLTAAPTLFTLWRGGSGARADLARALSAPAQVHPEAFSRALSLVSGRGWEAMVLNQDWTWPAGLERALDLSQWLLVIGLAAGLFFLFFRSAFGRPESEPAPEREPVRQVVTSLVPVWLLAAPVFFLYGSTPAFHQYLLTSAPAGFLLVGAAVASLPGKRRRWGALGLLAAAALAQSIAVGQALSRVEAALVPGGLGTPLRFPQAAADRLTAEPGRIVVHAMGDTIEYDGDAAVFHVLLWDHPHQIVEARSVLLLPGDGGSLLFTFPDLPAAGRLEEVGISGRLLLLPRRSNEPPYVAFKPEAFGWFGFTPLTARLANGAALQGWRLDPLPDGRLRLLTRWIIEQEPPPGTFQQFNHLYLRGGEEFPFEVSDVTTSSKSWQEGDQLLTWAEFSPLPPGAAIARFDIGMYTWPDLQRSPVLERPGDSLAPIQLEWVE